ncbi:MAG TPA: AtpZ/AtpI family protein [Candidatus Saccharimonadales bacterium]|nr:AtpZ/AtpI family protein [Candidatus Saccharimonadales bacterium]
MATSPKQGDDHQLPPKASTVLLMLTITDTTWRLFVPLVGMTIAGLLLDKTLGTKPWVMVASIILGGVIAYLLVRAQIKKVKQL